MLATTIVALVLPSMAMADGKPHPGASGRFHKAVCALASPGYAHCLAQAVTDAHGTTLASPANLPAGYGPSDLQNAYNLGSVESAGAGTGKTVAIVDAYHDPSAEADLGTYRSTYYPSSPACTSANGCFQQVNESGQNEATGGAPPATDTGWAQEISLDLDMVSAICPNCHILLVEANSASYADLGASVNMAASLGASAISNSYGGGESFLETSYDSSYYNHPGIDVTVSSGDNGYGVEYPAASQYVTAVGGTHLTQATGTTRGWSEVGWSGAGSGCSAYEPKPSWQNDPNCSHRTVADVSADADPNTGVAVYDSTANGGQSGWMVFGGTSVASPIVASVNTLAGGRGPSFAWQNSSQFFDVAGNVSNGSCSVTYLCTSVAGYDGPTGWGSPDGAGAAAPPPQLPPGNTTPPAISGSDVQGQTLTASTGVWTNSPTSYSYQWLSCPSSGACASVGSNASTYVLQSSDVGHTMEVTVTAKNNYGSTAATSNPTPTVSAATADFSLSTNPSSATLKRSSSTPSTHYIVTVNAVNGFNSQVTMSVSGLKSGVSPKWSVNPTYPGSTTLTLTATSRATTGTYTITIKGAAGTVSHTTTASLSVTR